MRIKALPFSITLKPIAFFEKLQEKVGFENGSSRAKRGFLPRFQLPKFNFRLPNLPSPSKKLTLYLVIGVAFLVVVWIGARALFGGGSSSVAGTSTQRVKIKAAKASQVIEREFLFPLTNGSGENVSDIRYFIDKAEKMDEIVVKGQRATAIKGRTFMILTLKITNEYTQPIEIDTKDYVRLSVNDNRDEWLAPDIHNDPVLIQASSTKFTRVGFPIYDTDFDLVLRVGEIEGEKEFIELAI